ncbi:MAG: CDP-alcohol phosphatidyltransferase family protein [Bryobacterales bacterium]|nr:CDP-alcohol phosphatidyltransferase family protein [Bryobacterales bacterium]
MQIVIALPGTGNLEVLRTRVCGVPLLVRVVATALCSGGTKVLLVLPPAWPGRTLLEKRWFRTAQPPDIATVRIDGQFDPNKREHWISIAHSLDDRFLWLPYDYVCHRSALIALFASAVRHDGAPVRFSGVPEGGPDKRTFERPTVLVRRQLLEGIPGNFTVAAIDGQPGISVHSPATVREAEAELVRRSGKVTDGIYSRFNRMLCRAVVRWVTHTPMTANAVTFMGLGVAVVAGCCFAQGSWFWNVMGAVAFFISGLLDEIDGMLARLKFLESPFGCWLETMADYLSYLLIFAGMTVGGYRSGGWVHLVTGLALLVGSLLSFVVIAIQRKLAAPADQPNEYSRIYLAALDRDAGNPISRTVRQLQFLTKKGVLIHYLLLFAAVGALPVVLFLGAFGANVAWIATIYLNRRLFSSSRRWRGNAASNPPLHVGVDK